MFLQFFKLRYWTCFILHMLQLFGKHLLQTAPNILYWTFHLHHDHELRGRALEIYWWIQQEQKQNAPCSKWNTSSWKFTVARERANFTPCLLCIEMEAPFVNGLDFALEHIQWKLVHLTDEILYGAKWLIATSLDVIIFYLKSVLIGISCNHQGILPKDHSCYWLVYWGEGSVHRSLYKMASAFDRRGVQVLRWPFNLKITHPVSPRCPVVWIQILQCPHFLIQMEFCNTKSYPCFTSYSNLKSFL